MVVMTYLVVRPDISASEARLPRVSALFIFIKEGAWWNHGIPTKGGGKGEPSVPSGVLKLKKSEKKLVKYP
jgi:hypothetical protein